MADSIVSSKGKKSIDGAIKKSIRNISPLKPLSAHNALLERMNKKHLEQHACVQKSYPSAIALSPPRDPFLTHVADKMDERAEKVLGETVAGVTVGMPTSVMRGAQGVVDAVTSGDSQAAVRAVVETGVDLAAGKLKPLKGVGDGLHPESDKKKTQDSNQCKGTKKNDKACSEPVMAGTGEFVYRYDIVDIPATLPIHCHLYYGALSQYRLPALGPKFISTFDQYLSVDQGQLVYFDDMGVGIPFDRPSDDGTPEVNPRYSGYELKRDVKSTQPRYILRRGTHYWCFESFVSGRFDLVEQGDSNQNTIQYRRTDKGQLFALRHSDGFGLTIDYNDQGQRSAIHLHANQDNKETLIRFDYHDTGYLKQAHNQCGSSRSFEFDSSGLMTEWRDSQKTVTQLTYDAKKRVVKLDTSGAYHGDRFEYNDAERITTYRKGDGKEWERLHFDDEGNLIAEENALGSVRRFDYDRHGNKISERDELGQQTQYVYNRRGQMTQVTLPDGNSTKYHYSTAGHPTQIADPKGHRWTYRYDAQANLIAVVDPTGVTSKLSYDARGNLTHRSDAQGSAVQYGYDSHHRLASITDPEGNISTFSRDCFGRITEMTDASCAQTQYQYATQVGRPFHEPSHIRYADGSEVQRQWDSEGLLVTQQDPAGAKTQYQYDAFDLLDSVKDPLGGVFQLQYDKAERLTQITNPLGEQWHFERDVIGRVTRETDFAGRESRFYYDELHRLIARVHNDGVITRYQYNNGGHLAWQGHYPAECEAAQQYDFNPAQHTDRLLSDSHYYYDANGLLKTASNAHSEVHFSRDAAGRVLEETQNGHVLRHRYDPNNGRRQRLELPSGATTEFSYGPLGVLRQAQLSGRESLHFSYDARGQETSRYNQQGFALQQQWDVMGRLSQQLSQAAGPHATIQRNYHYDLMDNLTQIADPHKGNQDYRYNPNQQITAATHTPQNTALPQNEHFHYDAAGNISESEQQGEQLNGLPDNVTDLLTWKKKQGGAITGQSGGQQPTDYQYDKRGRLIEKTEQKQGFRPQRWRYQWDADDRLVSLSTPDNTFWHYRYDALGRRIEKRQGSTNTAAEIPTTAVNTKTATHTHYLWDGATMVEEVPQYADGTLAWEQSITWHYEPDSFVPLAKQSHGQDQLHYIVTDHLGTPRELVSEDGTPVWQQQYSVWGKALHDQTKTNAANDVPIDCALRFQGQYHDAESGLHYNYHRYYDPNAAQYLSSDPIGLLGGSRPQGYVENPNGWVDPLGLQSFTSYHGTTRSKALSIISSGKMSPGWWDKKIFFSEIPQDSFQHGVDASRKESYIFEMDVRTPSSSSVSYEPTSGAPRSIVIRGKCSIDVKVKRMVVRRANSDPDSTNPFEYERFESIAEIVDYLR